MEQNSALALAYQMKENMKEFFMKWTREEAEIYLETWCDHAMTTNFQAFHDVVKTFRKHWYWILSYIENHITNGLMEWINGIIQWLRTRARWYNNIKNFMTMIYLKLWNFPILVPTLK
jgi:transposase